MDRFLEKLRSADESTKTRLIVIITSIIMVVVVYVWLIYFNNLFATASTPTTAESSNQGEIVAAHPSSSFRQRMGALYQIFVDKIQALGAILKTPREYIVKPN